MFSTIKYNAEWITFLVSMKCQVVALISKSNQVPTSIISFIAITVMNLLGWFKESAKMLFYHKSMFPNITTFVCKRMISFGYKNIAIFVNRLAIVPSWIIFAASKAISSFGFSVSFFETLLRSWLAFVEMGSACIRTGMTFYKSSKFISHVLYYIQAGWTCQLILIGKRIHFEIYYFEPAA